MAEGTEKRKQAKNKPRRGHDDAAKQRKKKKQPSEQVQSNKDANAVKGLQFSAGDIWGRIFPVLSVALAFTAIVLLYRRFMPRVSQATSSETVATQAVSSNSVQNSYQGVEDPWSSSGYFTTGNVELDLWVKEFCDALTEEGNSAASNAKNTFNSIVSSEYEERTENQEPHGDEWDIVSARHYFSSGNPAEGIGGVGDEYEFAAATAFCLQYFGFEDAWAIPIIKEDTYAGEVHSALVVVTDENEQKCVCDPELLANGWMVRQSEYDITVENIGQDLKKAEQRGLAVQKDDPSTSSSSSSSSTSSSQSDSGSSGNSQSSSSSSVGSGSGSASGTSSSAVGTGSSSDTDSYDSADESYGYGTYGGYDAYDEYGYGYGYDYA